MKALECSQGRNGWVPWPPVCSSLSMAKSTGSLRERESLTWVCRRNRTVIFIHSYKKGCLSLTPKPDGLSVGVNWDVVHMLKTRYRSKSLDFCQAGAATHGSVPVGPAKFQTTCISHFAYLCFCSNCFNDCKANIYYYPRFSFYKAPSPANCAGWNFLPFVSLYW